VSFNAKTLVCGPETFWPT